MRILVSTGLLLALAVSIPGGTQPLQERWSYAASAGDPAHGRQLVETSCAACHGARGNSPNGLYPKLAGQDPAYLVEQMWAFRSGVRRSDVMGGVVSSMSETDANDIASYLSRQTVRPDPVTNREVADAGARIYFKGGGPGGAPACAMCHRSPAADGRSGMMGGMSMMGMMGGGMMGRGMMGSGSTRPVPILDGQHARYVVDQLHRYATAQRYDPIMGPLAAAMSEADMKAVAEYVSSIR